MLLAIPTELQALIVSFLPRQDLASLARTSRQFHAVAMETLCRHVELRSVAHVKAFFGISSLLPAGSMIARKHAESRRAQWEKMRTLEIALVEETYDEPVVTLPRSLRARGAARLRLDRFRLAYHDDPTFLLPLFEWLDPHDVGIRRTVHRAWYDNAFDQWAAAASLWANAAHFTLVSHLVGSVTVLATTSARHPSFKRATLVCRYQRTHPPYIFESGVAADAKALVRLCPNADGIEIRVFHQGDKERAEKVLKGGLEGKPASFFSVVERLGRFNAWGDAEEGNA